MFAGSTLQEMLTEVDRMSQTKQDLVADTSLMTLSPDASRLQMANGDEHDFNVTTLAHRQIAERVQIPWKFYDRLREDEQHQQLLADSVNHLFRTEPQKRMVRTIDGNARAFLSNRYRRIDNDLVLGHALKAFESTGLELEIASCQVTEQKMYLKVIFPGVTREVEGSKVVGDIVQAGVQVGNSEVGLGSYSVTPLVNRLVCLNGMVVNKYGNRQSHIGRQTGGSDEGTVYDLYKDDTLKADDEALMLKMRDIIVSTTKSDVFGNIVNSMSESTEQKITGDPIKAVEVLSNQLQLSEGESSSIRRNLIEGADLSKWGIVNAVTATAHDKEAMRDYDRASEFETFGGKLLNLSEKEWFAIATAA